MPLLILLLVGLVGACKDLEPRGDFPCVQCKPLYDEKCQGLNPNDPESCATFEEANVKYYDGMPPDYSPEMEGIPIIARNVCTMTLECPEGTSAAPWLWSLTPYAWCEQSGPYPGEWRGGINFLMSWRMPDELKCIKEYSVVEEEEYTGEGEVAPGEEEEESYGEDQDAEEGEENWEDAAEEEETPEQTFK
uniref:Secreted protein n=1 Tax=Caenorhabditis tropicalis TaxID=1561998 RepID=A0A1I7TUS7_9PELO